MKRLLHMVALLIFMSIAPGCASKDDGMTARELADLATRYAAAWSSQDPAALAAFYADNGSITVNDGEPSKGREAVRATAESFMTAFPDMKVELVELKGSYPNVEFHWHWTGTNTGPGGTGAYVDLHGFEAWTFDDDGRILQSLGYYDQAEYERQLAE